MSNDSLEVLYLADLLVIILGVVLLGVTRYGMAWTVSWLEGILVFCAVVVAWQWRPRW